MDKLTECSFSDYLPQALKNDTDISAIGKAVSEQLHKLAIDNERVVIYKNIDILPETVIDMLAYDLHIDWYDSSYSVDEKRRIVKNCIKVHKFCGTKYAVETALKSIYPESEIVEWFEYGGKPFCFKAIIYDSANDKAKQHKVISKIKYYKNARSVLEEVIYRVPIDGTANLFSAVIAGYKRKIIDVEVKNYGLE